MYHQTPMTCTFIIWTKVLGHQLEMAVSRMYKSSQFEGTANVHCYTSCTLTTLHCSKGSVYIYENIKYWQKCEGCTHFCEILCVYMYIFIWRQICQIWSLCLTFPSLNKAPLNHHPVNPGIPRLPATEYSVSMETSTPVQSWQSVLKHPIKDVIVGFSVTMAAIRDNPKLRDYGWPC